LLLLLLVVVLVADEHIFHGTHSVLAEIED
jgi:hypothetical protein